MELYFSLPPEGNRDDLGSFPLTLSAAVYTFLDLFLCNLHAYHYTVV